MNHKDSCAKSHDHSKLCDCGAIEYVDGDKFCGSASVEHGACIVRPPHPGTPHMAANGHYWDQPHEIRSRTAGVEKVRSRDQVPDERLKEIDEEGTRNPFDAKLDREKLSIVRELERWRDAYDSGLLVDSAKTAVVEPTEPTPIQMRIYCPCGELHVDEGEFATKPHKSHTCQRCGLTFKVANVPTVGVRFLPGTQNEPSR